MITIPVRPVRTALAVLTAGLVGVLVLAAPVGAHGGEGELAVVSMTRDGDAVTLTVRLTYVDDGHGVPDATVTAVADGATPSSLEAGATEGDYTGSVAAPPGATVRITSVDPAATIETTAPPAEEPGTETTVEDDTSTTTTSGATTTATTAPQGDPVTADEGDDDSGSPLPVIFGIAAVVAVVAALCVLMLRRTKPPADPT